MLKEQKGLIQVLIIILIVVGLLAGLYLVQQQTNLFPKAAPVSQWTNKESVQVRPIQNKADLEATLKDLDGTNIDDLQSELSQNDADAASF